MEEALDLSFERLLMMMMAKYVIYAWSRDTSSVGGILSKSSRTAVGHTRPSVQWVNEVLSEWGGGYSGPGVMLTILST